MILVTGGTGIVGSHLIVELIRRGAEKIKVLCRPAADREALIRLLRLNDLNANQLFFIEGDILDPVSLAGALKDCDEVYHCAAMVSFEASKADLLYRVNAQGTANVVNACLSQNVEKLCYISSTATIGDELINGEFTEASRWTTDKNRSHYSLSKRFAEFEALRGREEGLKVLIVNPSVVVGPGRWGESSTEIIVACAKGMRFYPPGGNGFVDTRDIARFCVDGMEKGWFEGRFLLVGASLKFKEYFTLICSAFGSNIPSISASAATVLLIGKLIAVLEFLGINPFRLTSENMKSAARVAIYSSARAQSLGFQFTPIADSVLYTVDVFRAAK